MKEGLAERLQAEWQELLARQEKGNIDNDDERAAKLAEYAAQGQTARWIAGVVKKNHCYVVFLLRYHRWVLVTTVTKIPEWLFRKYWNQIADTSARRGAKGYDPAYEQKVFEQIDVMLRQGKKPIAAHRKVKPVVAIDIRTAKDPFKALRKEARQVFHRLQPTLDKLRGLMGCDRSTFAPSIIAGHAQVLEREINALFTLLAGEGKKDGTQEFSGNAAAE